MFRSASDLYQASCGSQTKPGAVRKKQYKPGENRIENEIRCSTPFWICIKRAVEAKQNQELWERSHTKPGENQIENEIRCSSPFQICIKRVVEAKQNQELWERSRFILSELWKPNKTRSCGKEAKQNLGNSCKLLLHKSKNGFT